MRKPTPATIISTVALFFSLGGGAMAATGYRITSIWQIAPKVRKELRSSVSPQPPVIKLPVGVARPCPAYSYACSVPANLIGVMAVWNLNGNHRWAVVDADYFAQH